jgi:predicted nucleotide-binding protein
LRVAIVGSWRGVDSEAWGLKDESGFSAACNRLGALIVAQGHTLLVASDEKHTADFHAVVGALEALKKQTVSAPAVVVYGERSKFAAWLQEYPKLVVHEYAAESSPEIAKLLQVKEVDCVIPIGGADNTYQAALAAAVCGKQVLPVGHFGGAAKRIHKLLSVHYDSWRRLPPKDLLGILGDAWSDHVCDWVATQLGRGRKLLIIHGRSPDRNKVKKYLKDVLHLPEPVLMREEFGYGKTLPEKWEMVADGIDGALAVVTPDDVGGLAPTKKKEPQEKRARQNVWLEVGWFWGRAGRERILLLVRGDAVIPSDLLGTETVAYEKSPLETQARIRIDQFIESLGRHLPK